MTLPTDIPFSGTLIPAGPFPAGYSTLNQGGPFSVVDDTARNAIPNYYRIEGAECFVQATGLYWKLKAAPWAGDATDWTPRDAIVFEGGSPTQNIVTRKTNAGYVDPLKQGAVNLSSDTDQVGNGALNDFAGILAGDLNNAVGAYSGVLAGLRNTTSGSGSAALGGNDCISYGPNSVTCGNQCTAGTNGGAGDGAVAFGVGTLASGDGSFAAGQLTTASGTNSVAFGLNCTASGTGSVAMGSGTTSAGVGSLALGTSIGVYGDYALGIGQGGFIVGDGCLAVGFGNGAIADGSVCLGSQNNGQGQYACCIGYRCVTNGNYSSAFGLDAYAPRVGQWVYASGGFPLYNPTGSNGTSLLVMRGQTPGAAAGETVNLGYDTTAGVFFQCNANKAYACKLTTIAGGVQAGPTLVAAKMTREFLLIYDGAAPVQIIADPLVSNGSVGTGTWTLDVLGGGSNPEIYIQFGTGISTTITNVAAKFEFTEIGLLQ